VVQFHEVDCLSRIELRALHRLPNGTTPRQGIDTSLSHSLDTMRTCELLPFDMDRQA